MRHDNTKEPLVYVDERQLYKACMSAMGIEQPKARVRRPSFLRPCYNSIPGRDHHNTDAYGELTNGGYGKVFV